MVGLPRQVGARLVVDAVDRKARVPRVAPQDRRHAQFVGQCECFAHFLDLPVGFVGSEVDRRAHGSTSHIKRLLNACKQDLVVGVGIGQKLVVVELHDEGDAVSVLARHRAEHTIGRSNSVAAAFDGKPDDVLRVEVHRVLRERSACRVLDALIDGQNREIARATEAAVVED